MAKNLNPSKFRLFLRAVRGDSITQKIEVEGLLRLRDKGFLKLDESRLHDKGSISNDQMRLTSEGKKLHHVLTFDSLRGVPVLTGETRLKEQVYNTYVVRRLLEVEDKPMTYAQISKATGLGVSTIGEALGARGTSPQRKVSSQAVQEGLVIVDKTTPIITLHLPPLNNVVPINTDHRASTSSGEPVDPAFYAILHGCENLEREENFRGGVPSARLGNWLGAEVPMTIDNKLLLRGLRFWVRKGFLLERQNENGHTTYLLNGPALKLLKIMFDDSIGHPAPPCNFSDQWGDSYKRQILYRVVAVEQPISEPQLSKITGLGLTSCRVSDHVPKGVKLVPGKIKTWMLTEEDDEIAIDEFIEPTTPDTIWDNLDEGTQEWIMGIAAKKNITPIQVTKAILDGWVQGFKHLASHPKSEAIIRA